jgi:hypothetical protein
MAIVSPRIPRTYMGLALLLAAAGFGCTGVVEGNGKNNGQPGTGGSGMTTGGSSSTGGSVDMRPPNQSEDCEGWEVAMPKRLIRLSFNQVATSLLPVFGQEFVTKIISDNAIKDPTERTFPPLGDTDEGSSYIDAKWQTADGIATAAGNQALTNFATFTGCATATAECAQAFVLKLAERAFRHPLDDREKSSLITVFTEMTAAGGTVQEATQFAVSAIFESPSFLYRTEFGANAQEGPLTPYELASQLSYFVTDGPPDEQLLAAAAANMLGTPELIGPHVDRMLSTPAARLNLSAGMIASIGLTRVLNVVIDSAKTPEFNAGVAASMYHESELFVKDVLWNGGKVPELVTSRKAFINAGLASLYGVAAPTAVDADGFGLVELPAQRAGLLTSLSFLTSRSRPDEASVVGRGLSVNDAVLCQQNPAFPDSLKDAIAAVTNTQGSLSEREKADYRSANPPCMGCHLSFDAFGISLDNFDIIGRYRTEDHEKRPINPVVTLPASAGGTVVNSAAEMGQALASTGAFSACAATKLLTYALAETGVNGKSCATKAVAAQFKTTDLSFPALVRTVAVSKTITQRSGG